MAAFCSVWLRCRRRVRPRRGGSGSSGTVHSSWLPGVHTTLAKRRASVRSVHSTSDARSPTSPATMSQSSSDRGLMSSTIRRFSA
ncbi:hypothetical protein N566_10050 [Streptomycetaceae bacterium MP113-05]|nr:hypothetical protein N566_10050 [Streptomycetaceae bacterium MP113-05]